MTKKLAIARSRHRPALGRHWLTPVLASILLLGASMANGQGASVSLDRPITLDIAKDTPLEDALIEWGTKANVSVMISTPTVSQKLTEGIHGTLSARAALSMLLSHSGLSYTEEGERVLVVASDALRRSALSEGAPAGPGVMSDGSSADDGNSAQVRNKLQEVVVTASKRSELLQDVPIAVSAVGQDEIQGLSAKTLKDIARTVPGLTFVDGGYTTLPLIRGINATAGLATVGYYIDDTPVQSLTTTGFLSNPSPELYDLERVEVLKGPQGTLYGASSMAGTIRFITPQASLTHMTGKVSGEASGGAGSDPSFNVGAAIGMPIIDNVLGIRASAYFREQGGFIENVSRSTGHTVASNVNNVRTAVGHVSLLWEPVEDLRITTGALYQVRHNDDLPLFASTVGWFKQDNLIQQPGHDQYVLPSISLNYDFSFASLTAITSYFYKYNEQIYDYSTLFVSAFTGQDVNPAFPNYISISTQKNTESTFAEEVRLASKAGGRLQWLLGAFFSRQRHALDVAIYEPGFPALQQYAFGSLSFGPNLPGDFTYHGVTTPIEKETATFGEVTFEVVPGLKLTGGARVSHSELSFTQVQDGPLAGGHTVQEGTQTANPVTPKAAISYDVSKGNLIYGSATKGFRAGGVNNAIPTTTCASDLAVANGGQSPKPTYDPDSLWSYEVGYKGVLLDQRLSITASVFHIDWKNIQSTIGLPDCGFSFTTNFGEAKSDGAELEAQMEVIKGLRLMVNGSYAHARLTSDVLGPPATSGATAGQQAVYGLSGDRLGLPEWSGSATAEYRFSLTPKTIMYLRGDYQYVGNQWRTAPPGRAGYDPNTFYQSPYSYGSARIGTITNDIDVALFVNNIANARPVIAKVDALSPTSQRLIESSLYPRTFGISFERRF